MKNEAVLFMTLLETYFTEYMPYSAGLSKNTIRSYRDAFRLLFQYLNVKKGIGANEICFRLLDHNTIADFLKWLEEERNCSVSTRNHRLTVLSSFAVYSANRNFEAATVFMNSIRKISLKKSNVSPRIIFTMEEIAYLLRMPNTTTEVGKRDHALLNFMYATGARAQEVCDIKVRDIIFQNEKTKVVITGKGGKTRRVAIANVCAGILKQYINWKNISDNPERHVFSSQVHEHMTVSCVEEIFKKYINIAKAQTSDMFREKKYTPHTMRHTTATHMLEAGIPIMAIKNFLGHASVATTERYAELSQNTVNKHIREWNERWFQDTHTEYAVNPKSEIPHFLK